MDFLKEIQEEVLPEINDDLVKDLGKFKTLDEVTIEVFSQCQL